MRGKKLIKDVDLQILRELNKDYQKLVLGKRIRENLLTIGGISLTILSVIGAVAGALTLAIVAPNVIGAIGKIVGNKKTKLYFHCNQKQFNKTLTYLKNRHLIKISYENGASSIRLTNRGKRRYQIKLFENLVIPLPKKWNRSWYIVIFDIPEKFKIAREALRQKLKDMGFYQIQKSVFVFPYPCEKEINFISNTFGLENQIRIIESSRFQGEDDVKEYFGLK